MSPVYEKDGGWWFDDETGEGRGPFATEAEALRGYRAYCDGLAEFMLDEPDPGGGW